MADDDSGNSHGMDNIIYLQPSSQQVAELKHRQFYVQDRNTLVVFEDVLDVKDKYEGFIVARSDAFSMQDEMFDVAVAHLFSETRIPGFYNIPIIRAVSYRTEDIFSVAFDHFVSTGYNRCMIHSYDELLVVDTVAGSGGALEQQFTPYLVSKLSKLREEGCEGRALELRVREILKELGVRH